MAKEVKASPKKIYQAPTLQVYGRLTEMTKKMNGTSDHGNNAMTV
jgi:hypothetical protein